MRQVKDDTKDRIVDLVKKLNHRAKIIESSYGKVDVKQLVNTGLFKLDVAQAGYGWLQDLHAMTVREVSTYFFSFCSDCTTGINNAPPGQWS